MTRLLERVSFLRADLRGQDLRDRLFVDCDFTNANMSGAALDGSRFVDCDMRAITLHDATAEEATFERSNLQHAHIDNVMLARSHFVSGSLQNANLHKVDLKDAEFWSVRADWMHATTSHFELANVRDCHFEGAQFRDVHLAGATFTGATFAASLLEEVDMRKSTWRDVDLSNAMLFKVDCHDAVFESCTIFGIGVCRVVGTPRIQHHLNAGVGDSKLLVDDLKLGSFLYEIDRDDAVPRLFEILASKLVLILGRFLPETKTLLDRLHSEIRSRDYMPVLVDSELTGKFNATTLVNAIAMCARFVVVDVTNPKTVIAEVDSILKQRPVPVQPIVLAGQNEPVQFPMARRDGHRQLLPLLKYNNLEDLIDKLDHAVIGPCEKFLAFDGQ